MAIGGGGFVVGRLIQALIPLCFGARYNKVLRNGLMLDKHLSDTLSLDVALVPVSDSLAFRWVGKVSFNPYHWGFFDNLCWIISKIWNNYVNIPILTGMRKMRVLCSVILVVLLLSGCTTTAADHP